MVKTSPWHFDGCQGGLGMTSHLCALARPTDSSPGPDVPPNLAPISLAEAFTPGLERPWIVSKTLRLQPAGIMGRPLAEPWGPTFRLAPQSPQPDPQPWLCSRGPSGRTQQPPGRGSRLQNCPCRPCAECHWCTRRWRRADAAVDQTMALKP